MSEHDPHHPDDTGPVSVVRTEGSHSAARSRRRLPGCVPILVVLALIAVGGYFAVTVGLDKVKDQFGGAEDYPGPGSGSVTFEVTEGEGDGSVGDRLVQAGVVQSSEAYVEAAGNVTTLVQPGVYKLKKKMAAADAVALMVSGDTKASQYTFQPGKWVDEVVALLVKETGIPRKDFTAALADPQALGVPADAPNADGYLAAGSYSFFPDDSAKKILSTMVERAVSDADAAGLPAAADELGYSVHELMTVASLVESEGSLLDEKGKSKIARVIYNRLELGGPSAGFLNIDATVNYARGERVARLLTAEIDEVADNPYNTYRTKGLPPGPIATPGPDALEAAIAPADGPWFYYVTVNLASGETKFATTDAEFQALKDQLDAYCLNESDRC